MFQVDGNEATCICAVEPGNPLPTIGNSLKKLKSLYKVLTPSIKPKFLLAYGSS